MRIRIRIQHITLMWMRIRIRIPILIHNTGDKKKGLLVLDQQAVLSVSLHLCEKGKKVDFVLKRKSEIFKGNFRSQGQEQFAKYISLGRRNHEK
jgi:hypothetical protein